MKGIVVLYINFYPDHNQDITQIIKLIKETNKELFDKINDGMDYQVMLVPTTKEACRVEKIDFDKPFPRFLNKTHVDLVEVEKRKAEKYQDRQLERERERAKFNSEKDEE